jgi:hypothetical protein
MGRIGGLGMVQTLRTAQARTTVGAGRFIHQRQYIIDRAPRKVSPDWRVIPLGQYYLSHCPTLEVRQAQDADGRTWWLLGYAFQADPSKPDPCAAVAAASGLAAMMDVVFSWAGRWLLVSDSDVIADAGGVMPAYYFPELDGTKLPAISSSLAILFECYHPQIESFDTMGWYMYEFYPPPTTRLRGVLKLLPDQVIDLRNGAVERMNRLRLAGYRDLSAEERADRILASLSHVFKQIGATGKRVVITATAGRDSRVAVAAARHAGIAFEAMNHVHWRSSTADRVIAAQYTADLGIPCQNVALGKWSWEREYVHDYHTFCSLSQANRMIYIRGGYDVFDDSVYLVRSGMWEIGRAFFWKKFKGVSWEAFAADPAKAIRELHHYAGHRRIVKGLQAWIDWNRGNGEDADWRDLLYRAHRCGGYWSMVEQSLDLMAAQSILYFSSDLWFSLVLSATADEKLQSTIQALIVERSGTGLEKYPYNPSMDTRLRRGTERASRIFLYGMNEAANLSRRLIRF